MVWCTEQSVLVSSINYIIHFCLSLPLSLSFSPLPLSPFLLLGRHEMPLTGAQVTSMQWPRFVERPSFSKVQREARKERKQSVALPAINIEPSQAYLSEFHTHLHTKTGDSPRGAPSSIWLTQSIRYILLSSYKVLWDRSLLQQKKIWINIG